MDTGIRSQIQQKDLLAILLKSLDRALFLYKFILEARLSGVRASITIVRIRKFFKMHHNIVRFRFFLGIAERSIPGCRRTGLKPAWPACLNRYRFRFVTKHVIMCIFRGCTACTIDLVFM